MRAPWAELIEQLMKEARISQRELARRTGIGRSAIRRMLAGSDSSISVIESALDALHHDLDAIRRPQTTDKNPVIDCNESSSSDQPDEKPLATVHPKKPLFDPTVKAAVRYGDWSNEGCR